MKKKKKKKKKVDDGVPPAGGDAAQVVGTAKVPDERTGCARMQPVFQSK